MSEIVSLSAVLWVVFGAAAVLTVVVGVILAYHWLRYSMNPFMPVLAVGTYGVVSFLLLSLMFGSIVA